MKLNKYSVSGFVCGAFGLIFFVVGLVLIFMSATIIRNQVIPQITLKNGTMSTKLWTDPPFDIYMQFWMFNITNPQNITNYGHTPILTEKGPYSYRETMQKENTSFNDYKNTVLFRNTKTFRFDAATSCSTCKEDDVVTTLNVPYLLVMNEVRLKYPDDGSPTSRLLYLALNGLLSAMGENLFKQSVTVGELLYEGYPDRLFELNACIDKYKNHIWQLISNCLLKKARAEYREQSDEFLANLSTEDLKSLFAAESFKDSPTPDRMGFFYQKNGSDDGLYLINDGSRDISKVGDIITWNGDSTLHWWNQSPLNKMGELANMINGTDGTIFPPFIAKSDMLRMYISDICRSAYITYKEEISVKDIPGYRFHMPPDVFDINRPENIGFCLPQSDGYYGEAAKSEPVPKRYGCLPSGLLNITTCQLGGGGAPIAVSLPHFLFTPDFVQKSIPSVHAPDETNDGIVVDIEPTAGVGLRFSKRMQINVAMWNMPGFNQLGNVPSLLVPVLWLNESATIDDKSAADLRNQLIIPKRILTIVSYLFTALGAAILASIIIASIAIFLYKRRTVSEDKQAIIDEEEH